MPNGRSGGFLLKTHALVEMLRQYDEETVVGTVP